MSGRSFTTFANDVTKANENWQWLWLHSIRKKISLFALQTNKRILFVLLSKFISRLWQQ